MNLEEGVDKIVDITTQVTQDASDKLQKPSLSSAFIAGGMVMGGAALFYRGAYYLVHYIVKEKKTTIG